jgi:spoIIIJ-associated protein
MSNAKDFYSNSVAEAIRQACAHFAAPQEKLDIEVVETGSKGIFGLCKKRAHIRVDLKTGQSSDSCGIDSQKVVVPHDGEGGGEFVVQCDCEPEVQDAVNKREGKPRTEKESSSEGPAPEKKAFETVSEEVLESIREDLAAIVQRMGFESSVSVLVKDRVIKCHISGTHEESIVGPDGRTLDSLQYLVRKMFSRRLPDRMMVDLDAGNFRERRMQELQQLAAEMAEQVKENGKTRAIPALNPSERRVVHVALQDDKGIRSRSVGEGIFKKVLIYKPGSKGRKSGGRRRGRQSGGAAKQ